jgi:hypothetical protein
MRMQSLELGLAGIAVPSLGLVVWSSSRVAVSVGLDSEWNDSKNPSIFRISK